MPNHWIRSIGTVVLILFALFSVSCQDDESAAGAGGAGGEGGTGGAAPGWGSSFVSPIGFQRINGAAVDMAAGPEPGSLWVLGTNDVPGGKGVYHTNDWGVNWSIIPGGGVAIDVGPQDDPWLINNAGQIFHLVGGNWQSLPGSGRDIGVGADGTAWMVGEPAVAGGYSIYRWRGDDWENIPGGAVRLDVGPDGNAWVINSFNQILHYNGASWDLLPGAAIDIGVGAEGTAFIVGTDRSLFRWDVPGMWTIYPYPFADRVTVDGNGVVIINHPDNVIHREVADAPQNAVLVGLGDASCVYFRNAANTYDLSCNRNGVPLIAVNGLQGIIRSRYDFSLSARVGNTARQIFGNYASLISFLDSNVLNGLDNAVVRLDGQNRGNKVTVASTVGLGAGFDGIDSAVQDMFGVSPKALRPYVRAELSNDQVVVNALLNQGGAPFTIGETGTSFQLRSLRLDYKSSQGAKALNVIADTKIKPTSADVWVPTFLTITRDFNEQKTTATAHLTGWTKPLGYSKLDVDDATIGLEFIGGPMSAYRIEIAHATTRASDGSTFSLSGEYAVDRTNKLYAFALSTNEVPVVLALDMLAPDDVGLYPILQALKLDQTRIVGYNGQPARFVLSPTGGTILGHTYEKKSSIYGQLNVQIGNASIPAIVDASGVVERANGKFVLKDFDAAIQLDLTMFTEQIRSQSTAAADFLNAFSVKTVAVHVIRTNNVWSGGASATLHMCGVDQSLSFDSNNIPKLITDATTFLWNTVTACVNNAGCYTAANPDKGGLLCYPACQSGYHSNGATLCIQNCPSDSTGWDGTSCTYYFQTGACPAGFPSSSKKPFCYPSTYDRGAGVPMVYPP